MDCPFCYPDKENTLVILPESNVEFYLVSKTNDGTKKWYLCQNCDGVYCRDKLLKTWQISAETYTRFVDSGLMKDLLRE